VVMNRGGKPPKLKRPLQDPQALAKEALTCGVCLELIRPPIQQCPEGHAICDGCFSQLPAIANGGRRCPTCRAVYPGKRIRNLIADRMAELLSYPCIHAKHGCKEILPPSGLDVHIETCSFDPDRMRCPAIGCLWVGLAKEFKGHLRKGMFHVPQLDGTSTENHILVEHTIWMETPSLFLNRSSFDRLDSPVFFFAVEVFALHAVKIGESIRIGVRQVSPCKLEGGFSSMLLVEGSSELDSVIRKCSAISTASSEEALMKETTCLCLDMDTVRSLCVAKNHLFDDVPRPTLKLKCKVTKKHSSSS